MTRRLQTLTQARQEEWNKYKAKKKSITPPPAQHCEDLGDAGPAANCEMQQPKENTSGRIEQQ